MLPMARVWRHYGQVPWSSRVPPWLSLAPPWLSLAPPYHGRSGHSVGATLDNIYKAMVLITIIQLPHYVWCWARPRVTEWQPQACQCPSARSAKEIVWIFIVSSQVPLLNFYFRCVTDPLTHHGRHFCRTVHALCNVQALLTNGILRMVELADEPEENFTAEYVICYLNTLLCHLLTLPYYPENDVNMPYSKNFWRLFLGWKSVLYRVRKMNWLLLLSW